MEFEYFYCDHCGYEVCEDIEVAYIRSVANGDICYCPSCGEEVLISEEWLIEG